MSLLTLSDFLDLAATSNNLSREKLLTKSITVSDNRYFMRTLHEQAQQNLHVPEDTWELLSPRLRHMLGCSQFDHKPSL